MERTVKERNILDQFCEKFCRIIEKYCQYIIVSDFVAIASGRTRGTEDIDMIIEKIPLEKLRLLFNDLIKNSFVCMQTNDVNEAYDYLQDKLSLRFTLKNHPLPEMEVKFAKDLLDDEQLKNKIKLPLTELDVWFSNININIAFKEELLKSPKDLEDARHLRLVYSEMVNEAEINRVKTLIKRFRL